MEGKIVVVCAMDLPVLHGFLHAIFSEEAVAGIEGFLNFFGRLAFADGDKVNGIWIMAVYGGRGFDVLPDGLNVFCNAHVGKYSVARLKVKRAKRKGAIERPFKIL